MPLLRRQPFEKQKPPPDLDPDEEVFFCKLTNEIFRDYEEFFERIILCNSLLWSCEITGKWGLTYQEAVECEERARKHLSTFPDYLQRPILYLACLTHRSRLAGMNDDVFVFARDRYFIEEVVDVVYDGIRKPYKVVKVIPPPEEDMRTWPLTSENAGNGHAGFPYDKSKNTGIDASLYKYVVFDTIKSLTVTVKASQISRKKGLYTRDKSKLFLKQKCYVADGIWKVKENVIKALSLNEVDFESFFAGSPPAFATSQIKKKKSQTFASDGSYLDSPRKIQELQRRQLSETRRLTDALALDKREKEEQAFLAKLTPGERAALKERMKQERLAERIARKEELKKRLDEERLRKKEEKAKEREKKREEKRLQAEFLKEWNRPREDLECDDLKILPEPTPIQTRLPVELFGDVILVLEFVHNFKSLFDLNEYFPGSFTLEILEDALLSSDVNGPLTDLLLMLLVAMFNLQEAEEEEEEELEKENRKDNMYDIENETGTSDMSTNQLIQTATIVAQQPQLNHGTPLRKLQLDSFTLSEILRLHLISSGAKANASNAKFRYQQRGGFTSLDDPSLELRRVEPKIMKALSCENLFDLSPGEKLKVLVTLIHQFLTYAATRDLIEDNFEKLRQIRMDLKQLQWAEMRRDREETQARYKRRLIERARERRLDAKLQKDREGHHLIAEYDEIGLKEDGYKVLKGKNKLLQIDKFNKLEDLEKINEEELTEEELDAYWQKREQLEAKRKEEFFEKEKELVKALAKHQHGNAVYPVGRDRIYRRYWLFNGLLGLFVEDDDSCVPNKLLQSSPTSDLIVEDDSFDQGPCSLSSVSSKGERSSLENALKCDSITGVETPNGYVKTANCINTNSLMNGDCNSSNQPAWDIDEDCSSNDKSREEEDMDDKPPVLENQAICQAMTRQRIHWSFINSVEQFEELLDSLNPRGFREGALKQALFEQRNRILHTIKNCPVRLLDTDENVPNVKCSSKEGNSPENTAQEVLELNLRELIIDLEERIYVGGLGSLKVKNRQAWRDAIDRGGYDPECDDPLFVKLEERTNVDVESEMTSNLDFTESVVKDLAKALLQVEQGVEPKYLHSPLGLSEENRKLRQKQTLEGTNKDQKEDQKKNKRKEKREENGEENGDESDDDFRFSQKTLLEHWEESLLNCTSYPQIFVHLATLEKSIFWSKSALHARCRICRRKGDGEHMLLCDGCDRGHHMYCLKPPVKAVPEGDWFCPNCRPKESKRSPRKDRRYTFTEDSSSSSYVESEDDEEEESSSNSGEDDEMEDLVKDRKERRDVNDNACGVCMKPGMLLCCDKCPLAYHLQCANPPLKKVPKGKWLCHACTGIEKVSRNSKGKKPSGKSSGSSSHPGSRRESPRDSPVNVRSKKRHNSESDDDTPKRPRHNTRPLKGSADLDDQDPFSSNQKHYISSFRGNTKVQQMKICEELLNEMMRHEDAWPFLRPVNKKVVPDYYDIIKNPMDFSSIRNKVHKYAYSETNDLLRDIRLIFSNCWEYNKKTAQEYKAGSSLSVEFERRVKELHLEDNTPPKQSSRKRHRLN